MTPPKGEMARLMADTNARMEARHGHAPRMGGLIPALMGTHVFVVTTVAVAIGSAALIGWL